MSKLDKWEAEAKEYIAPANCPPGILGYSDELQERILALIDLVRKKDEALKYIITQTPYAEAYDALDLTERLK